MINTAQVISKTVTAPAPRKGFGELFQEKKNELDHFQAKLAGSIMPSMPGQNVAKYFDLAIGIDIHETIWPPSPIFPVPHIGMVFDIMGAIMNAIASVIPPPPTPSEDEGGNAPKVNRLAAICTAIVYVMKPSVQVHGQWVANAGTGIQHLPGIIAHILPLVKPMATSEMFMGSATVLADGGPCSTQFHPALSCNLIGIPAIPRMNKPKATKLALMAPTSMLSIITSGGAPVLVGGPPTIDLFQLGFKLALKGLGKLFKKKKPKIKEHIDSPQTKNPKAGDAQPSSKSCSKGEPVDMVTGKVFSANTDIELPGPLPFVWERHYNSDVEIATSLGYNWHHSYNMGLYDMRNGYGTIRLSDGREAVVPLVAQGEIFYNRREQFFFTLDENGYLMTGADKLQYRFNGTKNLEGFQMLSSIETAEGFAIRFRYHYNGALKDVVDSRGRIISVDADDEGRILRLFTVLDGSPVDLMEYRYDALGNMVWNKSAGGAEKYFEYKGHLLVKLTNQTGQSFYWEYEGKGDDAKCVHTWGDGGVLEYWTEYRPGHTLTRNSLGHTSEYFYDYRNLIYKIIDENGGVTHQTYNEFEELEIVVNPEGLTRKCYYNDYGKPVKIENENQKKTTYNYDDRLNLVKITTPGGNSIRWEYDDLDRVIRKEVAGIAPLYYEYEGKYLKYINDDAGNRYTLFFNRYHELTELGYPNQVYQNWDYDALGRLILSKDIRGNITRYRYDISGNMIELEETDGNRHHFEYDTSGNLVHAWDRLRDVRFRYGSMGVLLSRSQNGRTVQFDYDTELQLRTIRNEAGEIYRFSLDGMGNVMSEWGFDGLNRRYERDGIGRVLKMLRTDNRWSAYSYDGTGNVISEEHSDGSMAAYQYNADGMLTAAINNETTITLKRNAGGYVTAEEQGAYQLKRKYNRFGLPQHISSSLGADITMDYNRLGWMEKMSSGDWEARWQHDSSGLEIHRTLTGGVDIRIERDQLGRVSRQSIGAGNVEQSRIHYQWGKGNRLQQIVNELKRATTDFTYDAFDNLVSARYQQGGEATTIYKAPDAIGNLFRTPERKDRIYGKGGQLLKDEKYHYHYDGDGNLVFKEWIRSESLSTIPRKEIEAALGITLKGSGVGWQYRWQDNGMLQRVINPHGSEVCFCYDALGRRVAKQHKGRVTRWVWNGNVPLHEWSYEGQYPPISKVTAEGLLDEGNEPVNDVITWLYEADSFVPCAKIVEGQEYSIVADYLGTPTHAFDKEGLLVWERELDIYGMVLKQTGERSFIPQLYQGQYEDAETGLCYNRFRYYDKESGNYISQDPIGLFGGDNFYAYVTNSAGYIDPLGLSEGSKELGDALINAGHTQGGIVNAITRSDYRAHHIIPHKVWTDNGAFFKDIGLGDGSIVNLGGKDKAANGIWLPKSSQVATANNFDFYHAGNHMAYSNRIRTEVEGIRDAFNNGDISKREARSMIRDLQRREKAAMASRTNTSAKSVIH